MSNTAKLKKKATDLEQKKQFDKALQLYIQLLDEAGRELDDADLQLYNRVGDLLMRQGNTTEALTYYEKAVDVYAERGFLNNAIALCSKILRQSPARTAVYYKLGKISANKGFKSDAKKNFLEYADRMEKAGQRNEAFRALKEFADLCPDQDDIRLMLPEMLSKDNRKNEALDQLQSLYEKLEGEGRGAEARATLDRMKAIDPEVAPRTSGMHRVQKSNDLVFLDLTADLGGGAPAAAQEPSSTGRESAAATAKRLTTEVPALEGLEFTFVPEGAEGGAADEIALVESVEGFVSSGEESDPLDADAIEALLTIPDAALTTLEHEAAVNAEESRTPLADLERTAADTTVDLLDEEAVSLTGWEPTVADAKPAFPTPLMAPLIEEPVLSGSEFGALALQETSEGRPTPVHDLLLPTELPLLSLPMGMSAIPTPVPRSGYDMDAVDSPSPIDITDLIEDADGANSVDLLSELTSPFSRDGVNASAAPPTDPTDPFGIELAGVEAMGQESVASAPIIDDASSIGALGLSPMSAESVTDEGPVDDPIAQGDVEAEPTAVPVDAEAEPTVGIASEMSDDPTATVLSDPEVVALPDATLADVSELAAAGSVDEPRSPSTRVEASSEVEDAAPADVSLESIDAAFESAPGDLAAAERVVPVDSAVLDVMQAAVDERDAAEDIDASLLGNNPGFGDRDPEASTFSPSPRLSAFTLQPDSWSGDESPEVLIDGEWHDEHVGDAAHLAPDEGRSRAVRFDDLAAAMMWLPTDENEGADDSDASRSQASPFGTPHGHVSFGGVEDQLRRRLELVPENWALRRQLGEVLLDSGDREAGLYELDLAMVGYELSGDLLGAMEVADEIVRLVPSSVRHHQKRVEYSVRAGDRVRLVDAYMELGDALFRQGEPDKAQAVYARVLELSPGHERATFAVAALGTVPGESLEHERPTRLVTPEDAFAEWEPPAHVLASFVSANSGEQPIATSDPNEGQRATDLQIRAGDDETTDAWHDREHSTNDVAADDVAHATGNDTAVSHSDEPSPDTQPPPGAEAEVSVDTSSWAPTVPMDESAVADGPDATVMHVSDESAAPPATDASLEEEDAPSDATPALIVEGSESSVEQTDDAATPESHDQDVDESSSLEEGLSETFERSTAGASSSEASALDIASLRQAIERDADVPPASAATPDDEKVPVPPPVDASPILTRARSMTPVGSRDDEFVDLGEWLRMTEPERTTRMVVDDARPSGDEQADFEDMLRRFKRGVAENVEEEDFASHYDLGVAYKEMGLIDEAIAQFQRALRGENHRIKSYEALGQCFVEKGQHAVATALLQRAADSSQVDDHRLVGVLYLLGYSMEAVGRQTEALRYYQRVFAVDIEFRDVAQRVAAMEHQRT